MKFLRSLFHKHSTFENIIGYEDVKDIVQRALDAEENYNLLLTAPPASAKTLFLLEIEEQEKNSVYFDGSNSTNRILDILEEEKIILVDEIDKMGRNFQNQLLNLLENGRVKIDQQRKQYDFELKGFKVFATCNDISKLSRPLQSWFRRLHLPKYSKKEFLSISMKVCPKLSEETAIMIGDQVLGDIRDVISVSKLIRKNDGPDEIAEIISTFRKYGDDTE